MPKPRLKKGDITLREVFDLSVLYYKHYDDKLWRSGIDCTRFQITQRNNHRYDRSKGKWVQTGREAKLVFYVTSKPSSYKRIDTIKIHRYPVTFLLRDLSQGMNSAFRWRTGSLKKPILPVKRKKYKFKERVKMTNNNIRSGIQLDFFYNDEAVLSAFNLLFSVNYASYLPRKSINIDHIPYFDKHSMYILSTFLLSFLNTSKNRSIIK